MRIVSRSAGANLLALSRALFPVIVVGAGLAGAGTANAQSACSPILGVTILCSGGGAPTDPGVPVLAPPPAATPIAVTLGDGFVSPTTVDLQTTGAAADVAINTVGNAAITTVDQPGLVVNSSGAINGRITSIGTQGNGASGAVLRAADGIVFDAGDIVSTTGNNAPGLEIQGNSVAVTGNVIQTGGNSSNAVQLVSLDGPLSFDANTLQTAGDLSTAALLRSAGSVDVHAGVLQTSGSRALGLDIATNPATCVLLGNGGCDVTAAADQITTNGFGGIGALVSGATGVTKVNVGALQTGGDEAAGLDLSADPTVCATLGAGACDQNFTVGDLTTTGAQSPGALVRAAGNIMANVDVLRTSGADTAGLDLASDPDACVLLGKGQCGTSFNVGKLTTSGAGATGVLARVAGPTTGHVGVLGTSGDDANGIDIAGDPTACVLIGSGACDVGLTADQVTTQGNGAAAVLIDAPANVLANIGLISTSGNNAPGLSIITDPAACLALGPGSCTVNATTGPVTTGGDQSPGVGVTGGSDPITVMTGPVTTGGDGSPGVTASGSGPITVTTGPVTTSGDGSPGVTVVGGAGPVLVDTTGGAITTTGANADGIDVTTTSGDQTILAGPVSVSGPGSNGIVAISPGCSAISVTATGAVSSAQGTGILASSACGVSIATLAGAPVSGHVAGIDVTSGTGSTITIADVVSSGAGPAINADGAPALVTVTPTGTIQGYVDLTDGNDELVNNGTFAAAGNSDFGGGTDSFVNSGTLAVRRGMTTAGGVMLTGLEGFTNSGRVDLRNGVAGDTLTLPGTFRGTGASTLGLDAAITPAGITADRLVVGGAATGSTAIVLNQLGTNPGLLVNDLVLVDAGAGSTADAFTLSGGSTTQGFVRYSLAYDPATSAYALYGTPSAQAYELVKAIEGARRIFYRTDDAWSGHMQSVRDAAGTGEDGSRHASALWGQMLGSTDSSRSRQNVSAFGQSQTVVLDNRQDFFGGQLGYDVGGVSGSRGVVFGVTGGYANSVLNFDGSADRLSYDSANGGVYASLNSGGFFLDGFAKYEHYWLKARLPGAAVDRKLDGHGYGGKAQAGFRFGDDSFHAEPSASIEFARTSLETLTAGPSTLDFRNGIGLRGMAGLKLSTDATSASTRTTFYASGYAVHEFKARKGLDFANGGQSFDLANDRIGTYGHGTIGVNIVTNGRVNGFLEASGDASKNYKGGGGRAGLSVSF